MSRISLIVRRGGVRVGEGRGWDDRKQVISDHIDHKLLHDLLQREIADIVGSLELGSDDAAGDSSLTSPGAYRSDMETPVIATDSLVPRDQKGGR